MNVYFISGLGADERVFAKLVLPAFCQARYLTWIPFEENETLAHYARRLAAGIDTSVPFALVGLSLGGMIASEMLEFLDPVVTILVSSASTVHQLPFYFPLGNVLPLHRWIPLRWQFKWKAAAYWFIGVQTEDDRQLFDALVRSADPLFMRRATDAVLKWRKQELQQPVVQIHGTADRILPIRFLKPTHTVTGGTHLMVFNRAKEISALLGEVLTADAQKVL